MLLQALTLKAAGQENPRNAKQVTLLNRLKSLLSLPECKLSAPEEEELMKALHMNRHTRSRA